MTHDFNRPPHVTSNEEVTQKKRLPVYILGIVGVFLLALILYMLAGSKPDASDAPPDHPNPSAQPATLNNMNNSEPVGAQPNGQTATAQDDTATATDH